jgi:hypothetical protein
MAGGGGGGGSWPRSPEAVDEKARVGWEMVGIPADRSRPMMMGPRRGLGVRELTRRRRRVLESSDVAVNLVVIRYLAADAGCGDPLPPALWEGRCGVEGGEGQVGHGFLATSRS